MNLQYTSQDGESALQNFHILYLGRSVAYIDLARCAMETLSSP